MPNMKTPGDPVAKTPPPSVDLAAELADVKAQLARVLDVLASVCVYSDVPIDAKTARRLGRKDKVASNFGALNAGPFSARKRAARIQSLLSHVQPPDALVPSRSQPDARQGRGGASLGELWALLAPYAKTPAGQEHPTIEVVRFRLGGAEADRMILDQHSAALLNVQRPLEDPWLRGKLIEAILKRMDALRQTHLSEDPSEVLDEAPEVALAHGGHAAATLRGQAAVEHWFREGILMRSEPFGRAWGLTPQGLGAAVRRGELFSLKHGRNRLYLRALLDLDRAAVARVTRELRHASDADQLVFWMKKHGGLGGQTAVAAVAAGKAARVAEIARGWAEERGLTHGDPAP